jgi:DNA-directed RNA polymerase subunit RPC12/RpoP
MIEKILDNYQNSKGLRCPYCNSANLNPSEAVLDTEGVIILPCSCLNCKKDWRDFYTLAGMIVDGKVEPFRDRDTNA